MTKYLIALIIATTIYVALTVASYYTKYRKGKSFEFLNHITQLSSAFVWINIGNWMLDRFFDGEKSAIGWWLLTFFIGAVLTACLNALVLKCCEKIWPKDQEVVVKSMKMSEGMRFAIEIIAACICLAFVVFFCYGLLLHRAEMSISDIVLISLGTILFAAGTIDNSLKIIRFIKRRQSRQKNNNTRHLPSDVENFSEGFSFSVPVACRFFVTSLRKTGQNSEGIRPVFEFSGWNELVQKKVLTFAVMFDSYANPIRYFADAMRSIFLKGAGLRDN